MTSQNGVTTVRAGGGAGPSSSSTSTAVQTQTPLRPVKSASGFEFPAIWSFPPFFTLQPNPTTQAHQLELWRALVLRWAKHERVFEVNTDGDDPGGVFDNKGIKRKLLPPTMKRLLGEMAKNGEAAADPPKQDTRYLIYWRRPDEWGDLIYTWVTDNGLNASIMTFYEITDGDLSHTTEFYELPTPLLRKALETLVKRGKAQLLEGKGEIGEGVRFL
ncbi:ESCRT-II complex subunit VPS25 [Kwoniella heveanensis CBS 569]|uniref:ESCRT-II complex subunit VPS25 n=1 Tax=Kwoniella heveanensis BCC8398 TaxID=1296120 RepID=A0A1B9GHC6_9TREE|nr:ESCRT-II complex subunit VPS25 [Kwoniella heveanensis BCC8398]OCF45768.1 ESCRT-II complex subunit VPS25 [Kwoniella heveanensis CBS 569]